MTRALAAAAVLALLLPARAGAQRADRADAVLAVPADGTPVATVFVTSPGARYRVTVSGAYAYDRLGGLADCGYRDTNAAVGRTEWTPAPSLRVNGTLAGCGPAPDAAHTYTFLVTGDGGRLTFAVDDPTGNADNAGALTVAVETYLDVEAVCAWRFQHVPGTAVGVLTVVAAAHQTGTAALGDGAWTSVRCTVHTGGGESFVVERSAPGPAVTATEARTVGLFGTAVQTCVEATVRDLTQAPLLTRSWPCS